jgi:hypothetical protein
MRSASVCLRTLAAFCLVVSGAHGQVWHRQNVDLSDGQSGSNHPAFEFWRAGAVAPDDWSVVHEPTPNGQFAIQRSATGRTTPATLAVYRSVSVVDVKVSVRFKLTKGSMPSAGVAVRVVSPNDYYVARVSSFEGRIAFDHVVNGKAEEIAAVDADISDDHWQTLEVIADGESFKISLDGNWAVTAFAHVPPPRGQVALWSDRDSTALFDQIEIAPLHSPTGGSSSNEHIGAGG